MGEPLLSNNEVPLYRQLMQLIRDNIKNSIWKTGDQIPSETELGVQYSVSRITVRNAISELVDEGLLAKHQGKGTYVVGKRIDRDLSTFSDFTQTCISRGHVPGTQTLSAKIKPASRKIYQDLNVPEGSDLVVIERIRLMDNEPAIIEINYFTTEYAFLLEKNLDGSLYEILRSHHIYPPAGKPTIGISYAPEKEAKYLQVNPNDALLLVYECAYDQNRKILHVCKELIRSDKFQFSVNQIDQF